MSELYNRLWVDLKSAMTKKELNKVFDKIDSEVSKGNISDVYEVKGLYTTYGQMVRKFNQTHSDLRFTRDGGVAKWLYNVDPKGELPLEQVLRYLIRNETESKYLREGNIMFVDRIHDAALAISDFLKYNKLV